MKHSHFFHCSALSSLTSCPSNILCTFPFMLPLNQPFSPPPPHPVILSCLITTNSALCPSPSVQSFCPFCFIPLSSYILGEGERPRWPQQGHGCSADRWLQDLWRQWHTYPALNTVYVCGCVFVLGGGVQEWQRYDGVRPWLAVQMSVWCLRCWVITC